MPALDDVASLIDLYHAAAAEFVKGNPAPYTALFSNSDDVSVANPFGPVACGWADASATMERAASLWRDGEVVGFENLVTTVTPDLAYIVEVERFRARIGGQADTSSVVLRTTSVFRREEDGWRIVHRHADPITTPRPPESVVQTQP